MRNTSKLLVSSLCLLTACATIATACGDTSPSDDEGTNSSATVRQASSSTEVIVEEPIALGTGVQSSEPQGTNASCWNLPALSENDYTDLQPEDKIYATHRWSSTLEEARKEVDVELEGDAEFGQISADVDAAFNSTRETFQDTEVILIAFDIETVDANFVPPPEMNPDRCGMVESTADFLTECGDQYVAGKDYGGYLLLVGSASELEEDQKLEISADIGAGYADISGNLAVYIQLIDELQQNGFEFRAVSRGFTNLLPSVSQDPTQPIDASAAINELATIRQDWVSDYSNGVMPGSTSNYGITISQDIRPYEPDTSVYERCAGEEPTDGLACFTRFMRENTPQKSAFRTYRRSAKTPIDNPGQYYWGDGQAEVQANQAAYEEFEALVTNCLNRIKSVAEKCHNTGLTSNDPDEICQDCNQGEVVYNCPPDPNDETICDGTGAERMECSLENIQAEATELPSEVMPIADLPASQRFPMEHSADQYAGTQILGKTDAKFCMLAGFSGAFAGNSESVLLHQTANDEWALTVESDRTERNEKLTGNVWCANAGFFYDGDGNNFTTYPGIKAAETGGGSQYAEFKDSSGNPLPDTYATALTGIAGNFNGGSEWAKMDRGNVPMRLQAYTMSSDLIARGVAFGLDNPAYGAIDRGEYGTTKTATTHSKPQENVIKRRLIPVGDGVCYLHKLQGEFDGTNEWARVYPEDGRWTVAAHGVCTKREGLFNNGDCLDRKYVSASAVCYQYDQSK